MAFVYSVSSGSATAYTTNSSATTEDAYLALRQVTRNFALIALWVAGRGAVLTTLTGISHRVKRWLTAGSGGTDLNTAGNVAPRRIGTTAATLGRDKLTALTPGTSGGAYQLVIGCGGASPGGWVAPNEDAKILVEAGGSDELAIYSVTGGTSMPFDASCEIEE